jgi:hypothetical protein
VHQQEEERVVSKHQIRGKLEDGVTQNSEGLKRRDLLLSGSSLLAASVLSNAGLTTSAQAQQQPSPSGRPPNILFIMGDDVGWFNIGAYHRGMMSGKIPNLDSLPRKACCSPTTTRRRAARLAARTSSPASFQYARA